ncbi:NADPH-dependent FMN reductase [Nonomuraea ferruginea]
MVGADLRARRLRVRHPRVQPLVHGGALKNAIDFLFHEWGDKSAGLVSYGVDGGARAAEHLRQVLGQVKIADVLTQVTLSLYTDFENMSVLAPGPHQEERVTVMLDQVGSWAKALRPLRV